MLQNRREEYRVTLKQKASMKAIYQAIGKRILADDAAQKSCIARMFLRKKK